MSTYSDQVLTDKLEKLSNSQQSIQTLCHWVMYHRKRFKQSVEIWDREMRKASKERKLTFLYLANDIMQNSRKRGGEFIQEFGRILKDSLNHIFCESIPQAKPIILRIISIWDERRVFPPQFITELKNDLQEHRSPLTSDQINDRSDDSRKTGSLSSGAAEIEEFASLCDLHAERVFQIRSQILSPDFLKNFQTKEEMSEPAQEVETAYNTIETYIAHLEEDLRKRLRLLAQLNQSIQHTNSKLEISKKQLLDFDNLKDGMKALFERLPSASSLIPSNSSTDPAAGLQYLNLGQSLMNLDKVPEEILPVDENEYTPTSSYNKLKPDTFEMVGQTSSNFGPVLVPQGNFPTPINFFPQSTGNSPSSASSVNTSLLLEETQENEELPFQDRPSPYSSFTHQLNSPKHGQNFPATPNYTFLR